MVSGKTGHWPAYCVESRHPIDCNARALMVSAPPTNANKCNFCLRCRHGLHHARQTGDIVTGDIALQTRTIMDNIKYLLEYNGLSMANIVKCIIHLTDYGRDFQAMNQVYLSYFEKPYPARFCGGVKELYPGCLIEIEAVVEV